METSSPPVDLLWKLSEIERKLAAAPDAKGYLELAAGYADAGWAKEAKRAVQKATALAQGSLIPDEAAHPGYSGPCTPRVLVELIRAIHDTEKSGDLRLEAPGGTLVVLFFLKGHLIDAQSSDTERGESSWSRAASLRASRYTFKVGHPSTDSRSLTVNTADLLATLAQRLAV